MNKLRRRIAGQLDPGPRGLVIVTGAGDRWVIENEDIEPDLVGRQVVAEGAMIGLDRLKVDWISEDAPSQGQRVDRLGSEIGRNTADGAGSDRL